MKNYILVALSLILGGQMSFGQLSIAPGKYWVAFTDKTQNSYSINNPQEFFTQRAIDRRSKHNIAYDERDLPVSPLYIDSLKNLKINVLQVSRWLNGAIIQSTDTALLDTLHRISFIAQNSDQALIADKEQSKNLDAAPESQNAIKIADESVADTSIDYGHAANQIEMLNGHILHAEGFMGQDMRIAVLDAGFYRVDQLPAFDSMRVQNRLIATRDVVEGDDDVYNSDYHGMKVLSTMAAYMPGEFVGTAPMAEYVLVRTEDAGSEFIIEEYNWLIGAEFADSIGADIITSSLGYTEFDDSAQDHDYDSMNGDIAPSSIAADIAAAKGILVVVSAGNEGGGQWQYISAPADADSVLTVGAVDKYGDYVYFSSKGPTADGRIKPDVMARGLYATVQGATGDIGTASGTSFSAPIMTGMVACLWQAHPELSNMQVINAIRKNSSRYALPDTLMGYGIPDFNMAMLYPNEVFTVDSNDINVYPNPFSEQLVIDLKLTYREDVHIEVIDMQGKSVMKERVKLLETSNLLDMSNLKTLNNGIYLLIINTPDSSHQYKMVKQ